MNKLIQVCSFPRSGTHWLMSLAKSRFYASVKNDSVIQDFGLNGDFYNLGGKSAVAPWMFLFGGHWYHPNSIPGGIDNKVYIIRDGLDAIYSMWRLVTSREHDTRKNRTLEEHIRSNAFTANVNPIPVDASVALHWHWSTKLWMMSGALIIHYEDLLHDHTSQLDRIKERFSLEDDKTDDDPVKVPVGYLPNSDDKGVGAGRKNFSESSIIFFNDAEQEADALLAKDPWYQERMRRS